MKMKIKRKIKEQENKVKLSLHMLKNLMRVLIFTKNHFPALLYKVIRGDINK